MFYLTAQAKDLPFQQNRNYLLSNVCNWFVSPVSKFFCHLPNMKKKDVSIYKWNQPSETDSFILAFSCDIYKLIFSLFISETPFSESTLCMSILPELGSRTLSQNVSNIITKTWLWVAVIVSCLLSLPTLRDPLGLSLSLSLSIILNYKVSLSSGNIAALTTNKKACIKFSVPRMQPNIIKED